MGKKADLNRLEAQMSEFKNTIQHRFSLIDGQFSTINDRLSSIESRSSSIKSTINDRLSAMEVMLLKLTATHSPQTTILQNENDISPVLDAEVENNSSPAKSATGKTHTNEEDTIRTITKIATSETADTANKTNSCGENVGEVELSESENDIANAILKLKNPPARKDFVQTESRLALKEEDNEDHISPVMAVENHEPLKEILVANNSSLENSANLKRKANEDVTGTTTKSTTTKKVKSTNEADTAGRKSGEVASSESSRSELFNVILSLEAPSAPKGLVETESRLVPDENEKEHLISVAVAPNNHEPLKEIPVQNCTKSANGQKETNGDNGKAAIKSPETPKVNPTQETKFTGDESGKTVGTKVLASSEPIRRVNEAMERKEKRKLRSEEVAENLVGSKINVFWPVDGKYYKGVIQSYDPATKMHKVSYEDGDIETLLLRREKWTRIDEDLVPDSGTKSKRDDVGKNVGTKVSAPSVKSRTSVKTPPETKSRPKWFQKIRALGTTGSLDVFAVEVESWNTIKDVKDKIHSKKGCPPHYQILVSDCEISFEILKDENTLAEYNIGRDSIIFLGNYIKRIYVERNLTKISLDVHQSETIGDVKAKIETKIGMPADLQGLLFASKLLVNNERTLADYGIYDECTLSLQPL